MAEEESPFETEKRLEEGRSFSELPGEEKDKSVEVRHDQHQSYPIVINNIHKYSGVKDMEHFFRKNEVFLQYKKIKKAPQKNFAFMTFENSEDQKTAMDKIHGLVFKGQKLSCAFKDHDRSSKKRDRRYCSVLVLFLFPSSNSCNLFQSMVFFKQRIERGRQ